MAEVSAKELVRSKLPALSQGPYTTSSDSTHNLEFKGILGYWSEFESEVRKSTLSQTWNQHILSHKSLDEKTSPFYLSKEFYACGDEYSIQGRFGQNTGQVMSAVLQSLGMDIRFGDFKTCLSTKNPSRKLPDFVLISADGTRLAVGEGETPWAHDLYLSMKSEKKLRNTLGQLANYMSLMKLKFGFLTTYETTIFLKVQIDTKGNPAIWHSNIIRSDTSYVDVQSELEPKPSNIHDKVTVRECFLFIGREITSKAPDTNRHRFEIKLPSSWIARHTKSSKSDVSGASHKYISDNENNPPPSQSTAPPLPQQQETQQIKQPAVPESRDDTQPQPSRMSTRSRTRELEAQTDQLSLGNDGIQRQDPPRSRSRSQGHQIIPLMHNGYVMVFFDNDANVHYIRDHDGKGVKVSVMQDKKGNPYINLNGQTVPVKLENGATDSGKKDTKIDKSKGKGKGKK